LSLLGEDASLSVAPSPEQVAEDAETSRALRDAVAALPTRQREVVVCRYLLDMAEQDTAQVLGIPPGTVKSRLARGLRALQTALAELTPAPPADRERSDD
jgi:RNA polymerase sigma-70 factor (ECF subfamily)